MICLWNQVVDCCLVNVSMIGLGRMLVVLKHRDQGNHSMWLFLAESFISLWNCLAFCVNCAYTIDILVLTWIKNKRNLIFQLPIVSRQKTKTKYKQTPRDRCVGKQCRYDWQLKFFSLIQDWLICLCSPQRLLLR